MCVPFVPQFAKHYAIVMCLHVIHDNNIIVLISYSCRTEKGLTAKISPGCEEYKYVL